ncbi:hypothetical protein BVY01_05030 [bacterium I07]|nr:hypothetical protein BVY01_05030 [bacterium I07]
MKKTIYYTAIILLLGASWIVTGRTAKDRLNVGDTAPDFSLRAVNSKKIYSLNDFKGNKILILHFWKGG